MQPQANCNRKLTQLNEEANGANAAAHYNNLFIDIDVSATWTIRRKLWAHDIAR